YCAGAAASPTEPPEGTAATGAGVTAAAALAPPFPTSPAKNWPIALMPESTTGMRTLGPMAVHLTLSLSSTRLP
ncbi:MAG: hypothetical protein WCK89_23675, partial [bacterium]